MRVPPRFAVPDTAILSNWPAPVPPSCRLSFPVAPWVRLPVIVSMPVPLMPSPGAMVPSLVRVAAPRLSVPVPLIKPVVTAFTSAAPVVPKVVPALMLSAPLLVGKLATLRVPPVTLTVPLLLKPPAGLIEAVAAVLLVRVPLLLNRLPLPEFCSSGAVLLPARFQVPALLITPPPLNRIWPPPFMVTMPAAALFQVLVRVGAPVTLVAPVVVSTPLPLSEPLARLKPLPIEILPVPPRVAPLRLTDPAVPMPMLLPASNDTSPLFRFSVPMPITPAPLPRVWLLPNCKVPLLVS